MSSGAISGRSGGWLFAVEIGQVQAIDWIAKRGLGVAGTLTFPVYVYMHAIWLKRR